MVSPIPTKMYPNGCPPPPDAPTIQNFKMQVLHELNATLAEIENIFNTLEVTSLSTEDKSYNIEWIVEVRRQIEGNALSDHNIIIAACEEALQLFKAAKQAEKKAQNSMKNALSSLKNRNEFWREEREIDLQEGNRG